MEVPSLGKRISTRPSALPGAPLSGPSGRWRGVASSVFESRDGEWRITSITLNGRDLLRVTCRSVQNAPIHADHVGHRSGLIRVAGSRWLVKDARTIAQVAEIVSLDQLTEV
jgi:hypothetical protein